MKPPPKPGRAQAAGAQAAGAQAAALTAPRRTPLQRRSLETVERIQVAATRMLRRGLPLEDMTTPQIAREAGVSIGALYRFFLDKQAIVDGIAVSRVQAFEQRVVAGLASRAPFAAGAELIDYILDLFVDFVELHPEFGTIIHAGDHLSETVRQRHFGADSDVAALARRYLADVLKTPDSPELALRWRMVGVIAAPLLAFAFRQASPAERARSLTEIKRLISSYLFDQGEFATPQASAIGVSRSKQT